MSREVFEEGKEYMIKIYLNLKIILNNKNIFKNVQYNILSHKEIKIKTTLICHFTFVRMAKIYKTNDSM